MPCMCVVTRATQPHGTPPFERIYLATQSWHRSATSGWGSPLHSLGAIQIMWRALVVLALAPQLGIGAAHARGSARYDNISDNEVREIQAVVEGIRRKAITYIGPVTVGCACEDGAGCADEVNVIAYHPSGTLGLKLSKIDGGWAIGPLQAWELEWAKLPYDERRLRNARGTTKYPAMLKAYFERRRVLYDARPQCPVANKRLERPVNDKVPQPLAPAQPAQFHR